jgi:hypothetical protein
MTDSGKTPEKSLDKVGSAIDSATANIGKVEKFINALWGVLGRNWGKLIVLSVLSVIVWFGKAAYDEIENPADDLYYDEIYMDEYPYEEEELMEDSGYYEQEYDSKRK